MSSNTIANLSTTLPGVTRRRGIVTGSQEISEVEAMIQRYLELAASALKETKPEAQNAK